jgi:ATP-dependent helicase/nuclease subunit B
MDGEDLLPVEIVQALEQGATVVTGNQRAARTLRVAFDRRNRALGLTAWSPPAIMAWDAWTAELWRGLLIEGHTTKMLLNQTQEHAVWREILTADGELRSLRTVDSLAEMAAEAWSLLHSHNGQERLRGSAVSADTRAFQRWATALELRCKADGFLLRAQLERTLQSAVATGQIKFSQGGIALVGFDSMTPARLALIEELQKAAVTVQELRLSVATEQRMLVSAADEREELRAAARWVRSTLEARPDARIAIIVPGLEKQRAEIDRVFREVLAPELEDIAAARNLGPFEFSVGMTLAQTPIVATALDLLRWVKGALPLEKISGLLLSPYFASQETESGARAEFDAFELRRAKMLRPEVSIAGLIEIVAGSKRKAKLAGVHGRLRAMHATAAKQFSKSERRSHSDWAEKIRELLSAAGWSTGRAEDSIEFQTRRKWDSALDELATLDFDGARVEFAQALETLERIAQQTMFAPESREAPIQIMGPLETAGSTFDATWFLRSGDLSWPMARASHPLLPWSIQCELAMPGTDAERDEQYARRMTERIAESAKTVVFSYATECTEGHQHPSAALNNLALEKFATEKLLSAEAERFVVDTEKVEDTTQLPQLPDQVIHGGAEILRLQAACGFRAFAERRLWATEIRSTETGMDAAERGTIVHLVLEKFWNEVKTQRELKSMPLSKREDLLDQSISAALEKAAKLSSTPWDAAYLDMQHERLQNLLRPWLELELKRPPFSVKLSEKELKDVQIGPLHLSVRVDRVDIGESGDIIIDYKTGQAKPSDWLSERPDAPQLPLYAVLAEAAQLEAVAFGQVRAGKDMGLQGFATSETAGITMPRQRPSNLEEQVEEWRHVLTSLAEDFYHGDARVRPKSFPTTCAYCAQRLLCRVDAAAFEEEMDDDETTEAERD